MLDPLARLKILISSSTPVVVIETVEETRAVRLIRSAADEMQLPVFEWSIADGLTRAGGVPVNSAPIISRVEPPNHQQGTVYGSVQEQQFAESVMSGLTRDQSSIYNTKEPAQVLAHVMSMGIDAVFILKDFHRHLDDAVVVRRLREAAQGFAGKRRTLLITAPSLVLPPELNTLVDYVDLPLPDQKQMRALVDQTFSRLSRTRSLQESSSAGASLPCRLGRPWRYNPQP